MTQPPPTNTAPGEGAAAEAAPAEAAPAEAADPQWFRGPSRREHWLAAALFVAFGLFFIALFFVTAGFWFRWVTLGLGFYSILHGLRHARDATRGPTAELPADARVSEHPRPPEIPE